MSSAIQHLSAATTNLAYIPSPARGAWEVGPFTLRAYAMFIIIGIIIAAVWGDRRWVARGGDQGMVYDVALWAVPFGLIGGRLYHVMTDWPTYFGSGKHPLDALMIWHGGLGIWGAVAFGGVGAWIGCRMHGVPLPAFGDAIAPGILAAQAIGRLGNYFNQELYGRVTTVPWGLKIYERRDANGNLDALNGVSNGQEVAIVQPTFLYELLWNLLGVLILVLVDRKFKLGHGRLFALYVAIYSFGRFFVELLRDDHASHILGLRVNIFTSVIVFVCAVAYVIVARKGREEPSALASKHGSDEDDEATPAAAGNDDADAATSDSDPGKSGKDAGERDGDAGDADAPGDPADPDAAANADESADTTHDATAAGAAPAVGSKLKPKSVKRSK